MMPRVQTYTIGPFESLVVDLGEITCLRAGWEGTALDPKRKRLLITLRGRSSAMEVLGEAADMIWSDYHRYLQRPLSSPFPPAPKVA